LGVTFSSAAAGARYKPPASKSLDGSDQVLAIPHCNQLGPRFLFVTLAAVAHVKK